MKHVFVVTILVSAFLLFLIQPLYAKVLLPQYGGGSAVWTACMVFFQSLLLFGYGYAYAITKWIEPKQQALTHGVITVSIGLLTLVTLFIDGAFNGTLLSNSASSGMTAVNEVKAVVADAPFVDIYLKLFAAIGLPYLMLSTTAPLLQHWYSRVNNHNNGSVDQDAYRLYGASNIGAFVALFSYPFALEYLVSLPNQVMGWLIGFLVFVIMISGLAWLIVRQLSKEDACSDMAVFSSTNKSEPSVNTPDIIGNRPHWLDAIRWVLLSGLGVVLLVSTTSNLTHNVPPIPFLWTLPLALYLLTFILTFSYPTLYKRPYVNAVFTITAFIGVLLFYIGSQFSLISQVVLYLVVMFTGCMICHGELYRSKPSVQSMTLFYLIIAFGGVIGSLFTSVLATYMFTQYYEFLIALAGILLVTQLLKRISLLYRVTMAVAAVSFVSVIWFIDARFNELNVYEARNFYGTVSVKDITVVNNNGDAVIERRLIDGYTAHGNQRRLLDPQQKPLPMSYYRFETGIGQLLQSPWNRDQKNVALVGLGVGALAYYGKQGDSYTFFELNPQVEYVANNYFDFLPRANAAVSVVIGDARLKIEERKIQVPFDLMVIDAFSSDAIPVHLLTIEALGLYLSQLTDNGIIAVHISNSYLDLKPVLANAALKLGLSGRYTHTLASGEHQYAADWVLLYRDDTLSPVRRDDTYSLHNVMQYKGLDLKQFATVDEAGNVAPVWTDNYSSIVSTIK